MQPSTFFCIVYLKFLIYHIVKIITNKSFWIFSCHKTLLEKIILIWQSYFIIHRYFARKITIKLRNRICYTTGFYLLQIYVRFILLKCLKFIKKKFPYPIKVYEKKIIKFSIFTNKIIIIFLTISIHRDVFL